MSYGKVGLIPPRYGPEVIGGAEMAVAEMARGLADRGWEVEVLTTCARDHFSWSNEYEPGVYSSDGLTVRRFPTAVAESKAQERALFEAQITSGGELGLADQQRWMNSGMRVPDLFHHMLVNSDEYHAFVLAPYLFWTTFACAQIAPAKTILMPCLHDEPYAYLDIYKPVFRGSAGIWFLSAPERDLAAKLFDLPKHEVIGSGLAVPSSYDPEGFRRKFGINERFVYAGGGRREGAKGWEVFLEAFEEIVLRRDLPFSLVTTGVGKVKPSRRFADRVVDLGFVSEEERNEAFAAADVYVQPSRFESFSRTIMEAWLAGTPVIANGQSDVVRWHCERAGAGLTYEDEYELEECLTFVAEQPEAARSLASSGRQYVLENYTWPTVLDRVEPCLKEWPFAF